MNFGLLWNSERAVQFVFYKWKYKLAGDVPNQLLLYKYVLRWNEITPIHRKE